VSRARSPASTARSARLLFVSNGHGEDAVAGRLVDRVRVLAPRDVVVDAWAMVGAGDAYVERDVPLVGTRNLLPSAGFATLSLPLFLRDVRAGWLAVHRRQWRDARALRGRYDLVVACGDIVPLLAAIVARAPLVFVGVAKSAFYGPGYGYTRLEKHLLRRFCLRCYPRDTRTAQVLANAGVASAFLGNPMMDDLEGTGEPLMLPDDTLVVACLPGSRDDAEVNAARILSLIADHAAPWGRSGPVTFLFAVAARFDVYRMWELLSPAAQDKWRRNAGSESPARTTGQILEARLTNGVSAQFMQGRFADVLRRARVAIGLAGTANEQAIGLGVPLVTFATTGVQGEAYFRMKMRYFGAAAIESAPTGHALYEAVQRASRDEGQRARMNEEGRLRMGDPGASEAIARDVLAILAARRSDATT
jgi:uncharacterized protein (TIGR03492 family)